MWPIDTHCRSRVSQTMLIDNHWFLLALFEIICGFGATMPRDPEHTIDVVVLCLVEVFFDRVAIISDHFHQSFHFFVLHKLALYRLLSLSRGSV
jgi:hypothetical protein